MNVTMFKSLLREAIEKKNTVNKEDQIEQLRELFKDDSLKSKIAEMLVTSHDYKQKDISGVVSFVNNYNWSETEASVRKIQGIDKPTRNEKVLEIANSLKEVGENKDPLITVDAYHGISMQSDKHKLLVDGHHRLKSMEFLGYLKTPVYHGKYTGASHKDIDEMISETFTLFSMRNKKTLTEGIFSKFAGKFSNEKFKQLKEKYSRMTIDQFIEEYAKDIKHADGLRLASYGDENVQIAAELTTKAIESKKGSYKLIKINNCPFIYDKSLDKIYCWAYIRGMGRNAHVINDTRENIINNMAKENAKKIDSINESVLLSESKIEAVPLTTEEQAAVNAKYDKIECSFFKDAKTGKYFCKTHRCGSKFYDKPTDIPKSVVRFVSSTA